MSAAQRPGQARIWLGRILVLSVAASAGALVARGLGGPGLQPTWARSLEADRHLTVSDVRFVPSDGWLGAQRGRLWVTAAGANVSGDDLWTAPALQAPSGWPLWHGRLTQVTQTPQGSEHLLAAGADAALVHVGDILRLLDPAGHVRGTWRSSGTYSGARFEPRLALAVDGGWRPIDEAAARIDPLGPRPSPPVARAAGAGGSPGGPPAVTWPATAPWGAVEGTAGGVQRWQGADLVVFAFHPQRYRADYVWGAGGPVADDGRLGSGRAAEPASVRVSLTADAVGDAGLRVHGQPVRPLRRGAATLALDGAGRAGFGLWDWDGEGGPWVTVIQRPSPLVVEGRPMPGRPAAAQAAAIGVAVDGTWLYGVASTAHAVEALGGHLSAAGAQLAMTVARGAAVGWHPAGLPGEGAELLGAPGFRRREGPAGGGFLVLRQRPQRAQSEGWTAVAGPAARPTAATLETVGVQVWRLDDDHWAPTAAPDQAQAWFAHGAEGVPGMSGRRVGGRTSRPMRNRVLTLCLGAQPRLLRWRPAEAAGCPDAVQGLSLVAAGEPAAGARGEVGHPEVALARDGEGRWLVARSGPRGDRAALAAGLASAGARDAMLLGAGPVSGTAAPRWARDGAWAYVNGRSAPAPAGAGLGFAARPGRPTARALPTFDREGCNSRRVLLCD